MQDYLGGDLQRYEVDGDFTETHYANLLPGGVILDTTASQYKECKVQLTPTTTKLKGFASIREKRLADASTNRRYDILKARVDAALR